MTSTTYPGTDWAHVSPADVGFVPEKLQSAKHWLDAHVDDGRYRVVICTKPTELRRR